MSSTALEDYLKVIYKLEEQQTEGERKGVSTSAIASRMGISQASVTAMVKKLAEKDYILHEPYYGAALTPSGRRIAVNMIRRHRIIEQYLAEKLGFTWDEVHSEAEVMEHAVSDRVVDRMWEELGCPEIDPHGSPIPHPSGEMPSQEQLMALADMPASEEVLVCRIVNRSPEELRYLTSVGLDLKARVKILEKMPFNGPIMLQADGRSVALDYNFARSILVEKA